MPAQLSNKFGQNHPGGLWNFGNCQVSLKISDLLIFVASTFSTHFRCCQSDFCNGPETAKTKTRKSRPKSNQEKSSAPSSSSTSAARRRATDSAPGQADAESVAQLRLREEELRTRRQPALRLPKRKKPNQRCHLLKIKSAIPCTSPIGCCNLITLATLMEL